MLYNVISDGRHDDLRIISLEKCDPPDFFLVRVTNE